MTPMPAKRRGQPYVLLPRSIMFYRPNLTSFEVGILSGLVRLARTQTGNDHHQEALKAGAEAIELEIEHSETYRRSWERTTDRRRSGQKARAPKRLHAFPSHRLDTFTQTYSPYKPAKLKKTLPLAGKHAYRRKLKELRAKEVTEAIRLVVSRSGILRAAGMSQDAKNIRQVDAALHRLTETIKTEERRYGPILRRFRVSASGSIALAVSAEWLRPPYQKIPLPLPTRSPVGLALYLFLLCIRTSRGGAGSIRFAALCKRLHIPYQTRWQCQQAVDRALDAVNRHLHRLMDIAEEFELPSRYEINAQEDRVQFLRIMRPRPEPEDEDDIDADEKTPASAPSNMKYRTKKNPRIRSSAAKLPRIRLDPAIANYIDRQIALQEIETRRTLYERAEQGDKLAALQLGFADDDEDGFG